MLTPNGEVDADGVLVETFKTLAKTMLDRWIAVARTWSAGGTHTLRVVVVIVGTAGRARVDLDALEIVR